ncbi:hypothetical protein ACH436_06500 [Isoptericola sp. NPDC019693]|uniref:hypothetical protein n=1 Tax=Isoptericola sp. NPDC019693 TaxID=3364009 RepID=UPI0037AB8ACD
MSTGGVGQALDTSVEIGPTVPELLTMAADIVGMVDGGVTTVQVGHGGVLLHVASQTAAEYLAWRLGLDQVLDLATSHADHVFAVWKGGRWPEAHFRVFCDAEPVRPLRAFPRGEGRTSADTAIVNGAT